MPTLTPFTPPVLINPNPGNEQYEPATVRLAGGGYVVAWIDFTTGNVAFNEYDAGGALVVANGIADTSPGTKREPSILALEDGGYIIAWQFDEPGGGTSLFFQRYDGLGGKIGGETQIDGAAPGSASNLSATGLEGGGWVFTWDADLGAGAHEVRGQIFSGVIIGDLANLPIDAPFVINTTATGGASVPSVAPFDSGFVVAWTSQGSTQRLNRSASAG